MIRRFLFSLSIIAGSVLIADAATVSGTVSSATEGLLISNAIVTLTPVATGGTTYRDTTDSVGAYSLTGVAAGAYRITAAATGYAASTPATVTVPTATSTVTSNITLTSNSAVTISGSVTDTNTGAAIVGALVRLRSGGALVESTTTVAAGAYTLTAVQAGAYNLVVSATGYATKITRVVVGTANVTRNIQLVPGPGVTVSGTVTDTNTGAAIVGAVVRLRTGATTGVVESTTTVAAGVFTLTHVQAGTYNLNVSSTGYVTKSVGMIVDTANVTRNIALVPEPAATVSGYVTDTNTGAAIIGAIVRLRTGAANAVVESTTTVAGGAYTLTGVTAGTYNLNVSATGYATKTVTGVVVAGVNITRNVQLVKLTSISGIVADSVSGAPVNGATVQLLLEQGTLIVILETTTVAANGTYTLSNVAAGTYAVSVTMTGYTTKTVTGVIVGTTPVTLNFQLRKSAVATHPVFGSGNLAGPDFNLTATGVLHLQNFTKGGLITLFSVDGKLVYRKVFDAQENSLALPRGIIHAGSAYIVSISQDRAIYRKRVMVF